MENINLPKSSYSEAVIRKALYWLSEAAQWQLDEDETHWYVQLYDVQDDAPTAVSEFHRLLNDFILREKLDQKTNYLRQQIVNSALEGLLKNE